MHCRWSSSVIALVLATFCADSCALAETSPLSTNSSAEDWALEKVESGEVDLTQRFKDEEDRVLSATFLENLLTKPEKDLKLYRRGVHIIGAIVKGKLNLINTEVPYEIRLIKCRFMDPVDVSRSVFLKSLSFGQSIFHSSVNFTEAKISGSFECSGAEFRNDKETADFNSMKVGAHARFEDAKFSGPVSFAFADLIGNFECSGAEFRNDKETADFNSMKVGGHASFGNAKFSGPVSFVAAQIARNFVAQRAAFMNAKATADFDAMKVGAHARFEDIQFSGPVNFAGVQITGNFQCFGVEFRNGKETAEFGDLKVGGLARFDNAKFLGPVSFVAAQIAGNFEAQKAAFRNAKATADFDSMKVGGLARFEDAKFSGPVSFVAAQIAGNFEAQKAAFRNAKATADFNSMKVGAHTRFEDAKFSGPVSFVFADLIGNFECSGAEFRNDKETADFNSIKVGGITMFIRSVFRGPVDMADARFLDLIIGGSEEKGEQNVRRYSLLNLSRTVITRELRIKYAELGEMIATLLQVSGPTSLTNLTVTNKLNLEHSKFANVDLSNVSWPEGEKGGILLAGMTYQHISAGDKPDSWKRLLELIKQAKYDASTYNTLEAFFRRQGYSDRADEVFLSHKRRVRGEFLSDIKWVWSAFLDHFVRYGRKPQLALIWSLIVVLLGWPVFRKKGMEPRNPGSTAYHYHGLWYSLDVFVPVVRLQAADVWMPRQDRWFARQYVYVHRLLGWVLVPIGLAAVTGIIK